MSEAGVGDRTHADRIVDTAIGLIAASLLGPLIAATLVVLHAVFTSGVASGAISVVVAMTIVGSLFALPTALVIGLPVHLFLGGARIFGLAAYVIAGTVIGIVGSALPSLLFGKLDVTNFVVVTALLAGAVAGAAFWLIRRPDRDAPIQQQK